MATKKRPGSAKRTVAKQEAARKRGAPGRRFVGETAAQSAKARRDERKKVTRMARDARKAQPAEAARTAGAKRRRTGPKSVKPPPLEVAEAESAFRAAQEDAALRGAEVEPLEQPILVVETVSASAEDDGAEAMGRHDAEAATRAVANEPWQPFADVSPGEGAGPAGGGAPPLGWAMTDLVRSALGLARTVVGVPLRLALAVPRLALRAVLHA